MDKEVLTVKQVAEFLQMDVRTIYKYAKSGEIPSFKISRRWRFLKTDIDSWVEQKKDEIKERMVKTVRGEG